MLYKVDTLSAPKAIGPYAQAVVHNDTVYLSGQIPVNPVTGNIEGTDIMTQAKRVLDNIKAILIASGSSPELAIKTTCYLKNISDFSDFNLVYETVFSRKPARTLVSVKNLPKDALIEIDVIAAVVARCDYII